MRSLVCALLLAIALPSIAQEAKPIVVQNIYYPKPGKDDEVYQWRLHASDVRAKLGLPYGRVLKKISGDATYFVVWECDYPSPAAREADVKALDQSAEFTKVQEHMGTLIQKFERNTWEVKELPATSDEQQIRNNRLSSNIAIKAHDTVGIAKHWASDITVVTSRNSQNIGKKQNADAFANEFKTRDSIIYIRTPSKVDVFFQAGMASESGTWTGKWKNGNESIVVTGTYYGKWIRKGTQWLIRAEVYSPMSCKGDSYCKGLFLPD
jgi:ketosteroid isomerase-like protein